MLDNYAHLDDMKEKLQDAKRAAHKPDASARDKADLKLLEQEVAAERLKAKRSTKENEKPATDEEKLDKALRDSFPGSDPVSFVQTASKARDKVK